MVDLRVNDYKADHEPSDSEVGDCLSAGELARISDWRDLAVLEMVGQLWNGHFLEMMVEIYEDLTLR